MKCCFSLFTFTAVAVTAHVAGTDKWRTKLLYGKTHFRKDLAGIVLATKYTFLVGNTVLCGVHNDLCGSFDADNREESKRDRQIFHAGIITEITANAVLYTIGQLIHVTAVTAVAFFFDLHGECDGVNRFHYYGGQITAIVIFFGARAKFLAAGSALKYAHTALAAK